MASRYQPCARKLVRLEIVVVDRVSLNIKVAKEGQSRVFIQSATYSNEYSCVIFYFLKKSKRPTTSKTRHQNIMICRVLRCVFQPTDKGCAVFRFITTFSLPYLVNHTFMNPSPAFQYTNMKNYYQSFKCARLLVLIEGRVDFSLLSLF